MMLDRLDHGHGADDRCQWQPGTCGGQVSQDRPQQGAEARRGAVNQPIASPYRVARPTTCPISWIMIAAACRSLSRPSARAWTRPALTATERPPAANALTPRDLRRT